MQKKGYHDFLSEIFCLTVPKSFVGEPFCASENFRYRKFIRIRGGREGVSRFSVDYFLCHSTEKLRRGTLLFCVSENFRYRKNSWIRGGGGQGGKEYQDFRSKLFCPTVPKHFVDVPFCAVFQKIPGSEKVYG